MNETGPLLIFLVAAVVPSLLIRQVRRDNTDPRVVFPFLYWVLTSGPVLWHLLGGDYYSGIEVDLVPDVLLESTLAILAFVFGASLMIRPRRRDAQLNTGERDVLITTRWIALVALGVLLIIYGYISLQLKQSSSMELKAAVIAYGNPIYVRMYYFLSAALFVAATAAVVLDSYVMKGKATLEFLLVFGLYGLLQFWNDEREVSLIVVGWLVMNARHQSRRTAIAIFMAVAMFVGGVALLRAGENLDARVAIAEDKGASGVLESLLTKSSSNLFVQSKVMRWVPNEEPLRWGSTYVDTLSTFVPVIPGNSEGLSDWFKKRYAPGGDSGYGFAIDAEAFLNFGWFGPPFIFALWGMLLGWLYDRAHRPTATWVAWHLWILSLTYSVFAIRADSRMLAKTMTYGLVSAGLLSIIGFMLTRRKIADLLLRPKHAPVGPLGPLGVGPMSGIATSSTLTSNAAHAPLPIDPPNEPPT